MLRTETIAAISTPPGVGGVAIIRISGPEALKVARRLTKRKSFQHQKIILADIFSQTTGKKLDRALVSYFKTPSSYTGEDTIEINCHGSWFLANKILQECLKAGSRTAEQGEFTKRAFLSGKIDLTQVEAISEMISAKADLSAQLALKHLEGDISRKIKGIRLDFINILAEIEAGLDYPEEIGDPSRKELRKKLLGYKKTIQKLLDNSDKGLLLKKGINVAIVGKTNAGKSSLFNALVQESRAIVTEIHGTTRDYLEAEVSLQGVPVTLVDTAGIRRSKNKIEKIGIERSKEYLASAELVIFLLDAQTGHTKEDKSIESLLKNKKVIRVLNKIDLKQKKKINNVLGISTKTGEGIAKLEKQILKLMDLHQLDLNKNLYVSSIRQQEKLIRVQEKLETILLALQKKEYMDNLAVEIKEIIYLLGEISGDEVSEEVISYIFEKFCVGK